MTYNVHDGYEITTNYLQAKGLVQVFPIRLGFAFEVVQRRTASHSGSARLQVDGWGDGQARRSISGILRTSDISLRLFWSVLKRGILYLSTTKADDGVRSPLAMYD